MAKAGRKKGVRYKEYIWTDPQAHEAIATIVKGRYDKETKTQTITDSDLKELCSKIKEIQDRNLEKLTNEIIGKK